MAVSARAMGWPRGGRAGVREGRVLALGRPPFGEGGEAGVLYRILHEPPDLAGCPEPLRGLIAGCLAKQGSDRPWPGEIIAACRAHSAGNTLEIAQSWLPPAVAAALSQHAVPPPPGHTAGLPPTAAHPAGSPAPAAGALPAGALPAAVGAAAGAVAGEAGAAAGPLAGDAAAADLPTVGVADRPAGTRNLPPGRAWWRLSAITGNGADPAIPIDHWTRAGIAST